MTDPVSGPISDIDAAIFSELAYDYGDGSSSSIISGYLAQLQGPGTWQLLYDSVEKNINNPGTYYGVAFINTTTQQIVISNRGTVPNLGYGIGADLNILNDQAPQNEFNSALLFYNYVKIDVAVNYPGYSITEVGHSLGGADADFIAGVGITVMGWTAPATASMCQDEAVAFI